MRGKLSDSFLVRLLHKIPQMHGKQRLARYLLRKYLMEKDVLVKDLTGFRYLLPSVQDPVGFCLLINGIYEPLILSFLKKYLMSGDVFMDIGANIGAITIPCASWIGEYGRVIAIECSPFILEYLKQNILLQSVAISAEDYKEVAFYEAPADHFGMVSIGAQFEQPPIKLTSRSLDSILNEKQIFTLKAIKIDVEGYESEVFSGASKLLAGANAPAIIFEFADWAEERLGFKAGKSQQVLLDHGYQIWSLEDFHKSKKPLQKVITKGCFNLIAIKFFNVSA